MILGNDLWCWLHELHNWTISISIDSVSVAYKTIIGVFIADVTHGYAVIKSFRFSWFYNKVTFRHNLNTQPDPYETKSLCNLV